MFVTDLSSGNKLPVIIEELSDADYKIITKKQFSFNWKLEKEYSVYKLAISKSGEILGLMSLNYVDEEYRLQIRLIAVSIEQIGAMKTIDRLTGNLLTYAARLAVTRYGLIAAVSLIPKTTLKRHYIDKYGFEESGNSVFILWPQLQILIKEYDHD